MSAKDLLDLLLDMQARGVILESYDIEFCMETYGGNYYNLELDCFEEDNNCFVLKESQEYIEGEINFAYDELRKLSCRIDDTLNRLSKD